MPDHGRFPVTGDPEADGRSPGRRAGDVGVAEALARFAAAVSTAQERAEVLAAVETLAPGLLAARAVRVTLHDGTPDTAAPVPGDPAWWHTARLTRGHGDNIPPGTVTAYWDRPRARGAGSRQLLQAVADLASQALERIELIASAAAMARLASRLSFTRSPAEAVAVILQDAPAVLGATLPGLAVRDGGTGVRFYGRGLPEELAASFAELSIDDPRPVVEAVRTGRRIVLPDRAAFRARYPGLPDHAGAHGMVSTAAVPLHDSQGRPVAALGLGWRLPRHFGPAELARLDTLADLCEQTLERTRLVAAEHHLITRLATGLQITGPVPGGLDVAVRYRPAMRGLNLGGDWYDLIDLAGSRLAIVVGDIVGHHIEAAADMARLRTVLNTLVRLDGPLDEVFVRFTALAGRAFWGSAAILVIDAAAGRAEVVRAGHPHPVLRPAGGASAPVAAGRTKPLGLTDGRTPVSSVRFEPGDLLVAYTDGLVEQRRHGYDDGVAALHAVVDGARPEDSAADLADRLLDHLAESEDDQALVVVRHGPPPEAR